MAPAGPPEAACPIRADAAREQYIRDGLKLDPKMVKWALESLQATRPDVAVGYGDAVELGKKGGDRKSAEFKDQSGNTSLKLGRENNAAYVIATLKRDGHAEILAKIERGEMKPYAAAVELGWRHRMVQHAATVEGFQRAIERLSERATRAGATHHPAAIVASCAVLIAPARPDARTGSAA